MTNSECCNFFIQPLNMLGCIPSHVPNVLHKPNYFSIKLNLASYNYLGFADAYGACADSSVETVTTDSVNATSSEQELGRMQIHDDLEKLTAKFLDVEDCMVFGMGFATNSMNIPVLVNHKSLIISDQRNHASIVTGCRLSGATIRPFRHNDMENG